MLSDKCSYIEFELSSHLNCTQKGYFKGMLIVKKIEWHAQLAAQVYFAMVNTISNQIHLQFKKMDCLAYKLLKDNSINIYLKVPKCSYIFLQNSFSEGDL